MIHSSRKDASTISNFFKYMYVYFYFMKMNFVDIVLVLSFKNVPLSLLKCIPILDSCIYRLSSRRHCLCLLSWKYTRLNTPFLITETFKCFFITGRHTYEMVPLHENLTHLFYNTRASYKA